jgi:hypothetical protein
MNASTVLQTLVQAGSQIDSQWSMYIVVHLGLFWFFFLVHRPLLFIERGVALCAYAGFVFINGNALANTYRFLEALRTDLTTRFADEVARAPATARALASINYADRDDIILVTHGIAFLVVALFLLFRNTMIKRYGDKFPNFAPSGAHGVVD